jgi:hypothetical protein
MAQVNKATTYQFPTPPRPAVSIRIDCASADAVAVLAQARLITERVAVATLRDLGCTEEEIDLVRAVYAVVRRFARSMTGGPQYASTSLHSRQ